MNDSNLKRSPLPEPTLTLSRTDARRLLLAHQRLWPPRSLRGKADILSLIRDLGCIQFDPINIVGRNPDLVLQSRVEGYRPGLLAELLYADRLLLDGWDKMASIFLAEDWPYFARHRALMRRQYGDGQSPPMQVAPQVLHAIRERGPLSSADLEHRTTLTWSWGHQTRLGRASLEILYAMGDLRVHHRVGTRRYFDLVERLLPADVLSAPDLNATDEDYQDWHVLRRVGGLGLANPGPADYWLAIPGVKALVRRAALNRLVDQGALVAVAVEGLPGKTLFARAVDLSLLAAVQAEPSPRAAILAPLDNLLWDRELLRWLFDLDYVWEVYKPPAQRKYGYYVLPVLYGDRFVARFSPSFDRKRRLLTISGWWWEAGVRPDPPMEAALADCFRQFLGYLGADAVHLAVECPAASTLGWLRA